MLPATFTDLPSKNRILPAIFTNLLPKSVFYLSNPLQPSIKASLWAGSSNYIY
jgi:hypothetical protein